MKEIDPIEEELAQAGEVSPVSPTLVKLDKCRIMSDTDVPAEDFLMRLFGKPCFPRRDLSTVTGTEKCGKTFFTSMLMACCAEKTDVFCVEQTFTRKYRIMEKLCYKIDENGLPQITAMPDFQSRDSNGQYQTNKPEAYQIKSDTADKFNQKYIIHNDGNARQPWEWDLGMLFGDALSQYPSLTLEALQDQVMSLSGIKQPKYYDKVFSLAVDRRVVQTTMDRNGRVVAILTPLPS